MWWDAAHEAVRPVTGLEVQKGTVTVPGWRFSAFYTYGYGVTFNMKGYRNGHTLTPFSGGVAGPPRLH